MLHASVSQRITAPTTKRTLQKITFGKAEQNGILAWVKAVLMVLVVMLSAGCAKDARRDLQVLNEYKVGASRDQLVAKLEAQDAKLLQSKIRPSQGWPAPVGKKRNPTELAAFRWEQDHPGTIVQLSEE